LTLPVASKIFASELGTTTYLLQLEMGNEISIINLLNFSNCTQPAHMSGSEWKLGKTSPNSSPHVDKPAAPADEFVDPPITNQQAASSNPVPLHNVPNCLEKLRPYECELCDVSWVLLPPRSLPPGLLTINKQAPAPSNDSSPSVAPKGTLPRPTLKLIPEQPKFSDQDLDISFENKFTDKKVLLPAADPNPPVVWEDNTSENEPLIPLPRVALRRQQAKRYLTGQKGLHSHLQHKRKKRKLILSDVTKCSMR
jgi:hypothetical protein